MWTLLLGLLNWFSSATFGKIVDAASTVLVNRSNNAAATRQTEVAAGRDVSIETIHADAAAFHEQEALAAVRWGWWGTRYLLLAAALPPIYHSGLVYLDSCPFFIWPHFDGWWLALWNAHEIGSWNVARAPGVYEGQELTIIATIVGYQLTQTGVGGFMQWLNKKS